VAELAAGVDLVVVAPSDLGADDVSGGDQVGEDSLGGSLGDADLLGDVAGAGLGVACHAQKHVRMVGKEAPRAGGPRLRPLLHGARSVSYTTMLTRIIIRDSCFV
jgi:hypothetical protein